MAPEYIKSFFLPNDLVNDKPLRNSKTDFRPPRMETPQDKDFSFCGAQVWNLLDKDLKGEASLGSLKKTKQTANVEGSSTLSFDLILLSIFWFSQSYKVILTLTKTRQHENQALEFDVLPCINKTKLS